MVKATRLSVVAVLVAAALVAVWFGLRLRTPAGFAPRTMQMAQFSHGVLFGELLDPDVFAALDVGNDESGEFVQIDDMRFRVDAFETFGYSGRQWSNGTLSYMLSPEVKNDAFKRSQFEEGCRLLTIGSGVTCIEVRGANQATHYVYVISHKDQNYSYVGRVGGRQDLAITSWSSRIIIAHEIKHALGWQHEHQRPDRDKYIKVNAVNIQADKIHNFDIVPNASMWRGTYDFESIMHYGQFAFTNDTNIPVTKRTIEAQPDYKQFESQMGQRDHVSQTDQKEVIAIYGETGTEWCGLIRKPIRDPPKGCFFACYTTPDQTIGEWFLCGSCSGATKCP